MNYYNEFDRHAAAWLRELINAGHIPLGEVDERSITDVKPTELVGYTQCHFFAGIGGWSYALELAGWDFDRPIWTGSCPCQPFSAAGKQEGQKDARHLWPTFFGLIRECRPDTVAGEQVASAIGHGWLDGIQADLEGEGYAVGHCVLGAHSVGAPHIRQRLYWLANANCRGRGELAELLGKQDIDGQASPENNSSGCCRPGRLAQSDGGDSSPERQQCCGEQRQQPEDGGVGGMEHATSDGWLERRAESDGRGSASGCGAIWLVQSKQPGLEGQPGHEHNGNQSRWIAADSARSAAEAGHVSAWSRCQLIHCTDGKTRRIEPESFPLVDRTPGRVGLLRGYGNAIVPQTAAAFIETFKEITSQ